MNSEGAKGEWPMFRRYLLGMACLAVSVVILAVLLVPIALDRIFPPSCIGAAQALAGDVAGIASESAVSQFLTSCERDIQAGVRAETNCVPPWLTGTKNPRRQFFHSSRMKGTNLCMTSMFFDGANMSYIKFCNDATVHRTGRFSRFSFGVKIWTNCSVTVDNWGK